MANAARVESLDALRAFRIAMCKFQEAANLALADAEGEVQRALVWLETEQQSYWQGQIRKRTELVVRAKEAVRMKKAFKNSVGSRDSAVDEEKALAQAMRRLEEAEHKLVATRNWSKKLAREISLYTGAVQRFATTVQSDIPLAVTQLDRMVAALEAYLALSAPGSPAAAPASASPTDTQPSTAEDEGTTPDNPQHPTNKQT
jgi:hypothetical protein